MYIGYLCTLWIHGGRRFDSLALASKDKKKKKSNTLHQPRPEKFLVNSKIEALILCMEAAFVGNCWTLA